MQFRNRSLFTEIGACVVGTVGLEYTLIDTKLIAESFRILKCCESLT